MTAAFTLADYLRREDAVRARPFGDRSHREAELIPGRIGRRIAEDGAQLKERRRFVGTVACVPDPVAISVGLIDILYQVHGILTYQNANMADFVNPEAAAWARENRSRFPIDSRPLKRREFRLEPSPVRRRQAFEKPVPMSPGTNGFTKQAMTMGRLPLRRPGQD